jgi:hypothetical protein
MVEIDIAEAAALSSFVREQLSVDCCAREFVICDSVGSSAITSLQHFLSRSAISAGGSEVLLSSSLDNASLECIFEG